MNNQYKIQYLNKKGFSNKEIARMLDMSVANIAHALKLNLVEHNCIVCNQKKLYRQKGYTRLLACNECLDKVRHVKGRDRTRELVRIRDKHTCRMCRVPWVHGRKYDVHHLGGFCGKKSKSYDNTRSLDGLITLCHRCHYNHPEHTLKTRKHKYDHIE